MIHEPSNDDAIRTPLEVDNPALPFPEEGNPTPFPRREGVVRSLSHARIPGCPGLVRVHGATMLRQARGDVQQARLR